MDPANPTILEVRSGGEGGFSHLGAIRSWSIDQQGDLVTGIVTAHYTFEDKDGDQLHLFGTGPSAFQADGRITFNGTFTVLSGTGKFEHVRGTLHYDGWARTTDFSTGAGIGFLNIEGILRGTRINDDKPFVSTDTGIGTLVGLDFDYVGEGTATRVGRFDSHAYSTPAPLNASFVGIVDGKFVLGWSFENVWTTRNGDHIKWSGVQFNYFAIMSLPDGSLVPDFSKPSEGKVYQTIVEGTGRFARAEGVLFPHGEFTPTSPTTLAAKLRAAGFFSQK